MEKLAIKKVPSPTEALKYLLRADATVQWRSRRSLFMSLLVPVIFLISWKSLIPTFGAATVLSICISVGLPAMGLMGYALSLGRDREKGIFQRLRAAPIPTWVIMGSRILVQVSLIVLMALVTCAFAYEIDHISIGFVSILLIILSAALGGLSFLALGQLIVAFIKSSDAINATTRLVYSAVAVVGAIGQLGVFGVSVQKIVEYSPLGTSRT
ncbi:MAG TPA: ABC transporter permease, partial [Candidatus Paceibacterota bacterium]|nr:ABC transporter permease [Candidatus Paceibacterota bacterium]